MMQMFTALKEDTPAVVTIHGTVPEDTTSPVHETVRQSRDLMTARGIITTHVMDALPWADNVTVQTPSEKIYEAKAEYDDAYADGYLSALIEFADTPLPKRIWLALWSRRP